ncbi:DRTGG domain-containing protein [Jeotgalibacillus haloalkalitolerans]|uniref:DRTGG domain-containing protein n=1 Tax=Jeotgalibacillus haloalkalitolerans TaxID=3104292 RepID=A0ABU5KMH2_9BACL|nr:DRTGG domain-containing protein [Jeotgalibacillus sp. HH7-29]MDZ5712461.1 DRTGG domain-containing protein [Jeotgalibacillus sp. HH7-29]
MATKHEQILQHIESLPVGNKISVRQVAKHMAVSEGTAYRAIKEAENKGMVSTIERVGTIRIEKKIRENIERLTYAEVVNIVDGHVVGGRTGLHKTLNKFVIGAMKLEAMMRYTEAGNLLIVGNRTKAHEYALNAGAAVLVTGGFDAEEPVKKLADELELPVISTSYDTFTVAAMINRAIYDQMIKKEIVLVDDILIPLEQSYYLTSKSTVREWEDLNKDTQHSRFPVVDATSLKVTGMVTAKDILGRGKDELLEKVMTKYPLTVNAKTSVASAAHIMIWEGIELLPVVNESHQLQGVISRQDVLKAMQMIQRQPQMGETIDDLILKELQVEKTENKRQTFQVTPQMTNHLGAISYGVFTTLVTESANQLLKEYKRSDLVVENITIYFIKPVQMESTLEIAPKLLDVGRKFGKVDVEVFSEGNLVGKAMMMCQLLEK